jgi:hypothetical protein
MKAVLFLAGLLMVSAESCRGREAQEASEGGFFPVVSYLQSQVQHVDTSVYSIIKISRVHNIQDTTYLRREAFKTAAQDFLSLPDLTSKKLRKNYTETKLYDADLKKVVLTYAPKDRGKADGIMRQEVLIEPDAGSGDQVQTIYVETLSGNGDSTVQKRMTWNVNGRFRVITIISRKNGPETVQSTDVSWRGQP